ncbi:MAG: V-type ATP synthase subunit E [Planctomycetota bacterium]
MPDDVGQLLAAIKEMADAEKAEIRAQAEQEIAKISERTEAQIEQFRDKALARLEGQLRMESECIVGRAELEIRDRLINEKNEVLREVFELASRQIAALDDAEKNQDILKRLVREAIGRINCEDLRLRISRTDLSLWESLKGYFPGSIPVVLCDGPKGTVIVETNDGSRSIDNSIETRLEMAREVMKLELVELLFDAGTSGEKGK